MRLLRYVLLSGLTVCIFLFTGCGGSGGSSKKTPDPSIPGNPPVAVNSLDVLTWHNDSGRTGANLNEKTLTPSNVNVNQFGKKFTFAVDGYVYGQPLVVFNENIGGGSHNVVYVVTAHDSVYAFDADGATTTAYWHQSFIDPDNGIVPVPGADLGVGAEWGVISTPVIDRSRNALYVVSRVKNTKDNSYHQHIHALDLSTGAEKFEGPVEISACVPGTGDGSSNGQICFDPLRENNRVSLALVGNVVYAAWASLADVAPYHGWILGYSADKLAQVAVFNATPNGFDGGYWMSGAAPGVDASGNLFYVAGNGSFDPDQKNYGQSAIKLTFSGGALEVVDYFAPFNWSQLQISDLDLGSGGAVLLPNNSSAHAHEMVFAGKDGTIYLLDRDNMGKFQTGSDSQIVQRLHGGASEWCYSTPAYWNGNLYFVGNNDVIKQFSWSDGLLSSSPLASGSHPYSFPGATPAISANGASNGIVWTIEMTSASASHAILHAYDATNVARELYNSAQNAARDDAGLAVKFTVPTITNGKVYIGTIFQLEVYGLL